MVRAVRSLGIVVVALVPAPALACGMCTDAAVHRRYPLAGLPLNLVIALGVEALVFTLCMALARKENGYLRAKVLFGAAFASVAIGFPTHASGLAMATVFAAGLAWTFVRSLWANQDLGWRVGAVRVAGVAALIAGQVVYAQPGNVGTAKLVTLCLIGPDSWGNAPMGWVEEQLVARRDAREEIERRLSQPRGPRVRSIDVELLRLHRLVGGSLEARSSTCESLGAGKAPEPPISTWHGSADPPAGLLTALCASP
jgi:hypothetical protein